MNKNHHAIDDKASSGHDDRQAPVDAGPNAIVPRSAAAVVYQLFKRREQPVHIDPALKRFVY